MFKTSVKYTDLEKGESRLIAGKNSSARPATKPVASPGPSAVAKSAAKTKAGAQPVAKSGEASPATQPGAKPKGNSTKKSPNSAGKGKDKKKEKGEESTLFRFILRKLGIGKTPKDPKKKRGPKAPKVAKKPKVAAPRKVGKPVKPNKGNKPKKNKEVDKKEKDKGAKGKTKDKTKKSEKKVVDMRVDPQGYYSEAKDENATLDGYEAVLGSGEWTKKVIALALKSEEGIKAVKSRNDKTKAENKRIAKLEIQQEEDVIL
uniref:Uncharacterized protein n=1 Tax=Caenorhabditis japonica TaxID=281687 RepID=A0A8R1DLX6_CAEJA